MNRLKYLDSLRSRIKEGVTTGAPEPMEVTQNNTQSQSPGGGSGMFSGMGFRLGLPVAMAAMSILPRLIGGGKTYSQNIPKNMEPRSMFSSKQRAQAGLIDKTPKPNQIFAPKAY